MPKKDNLEKIIDLTDQLKALHAALDKVGNHMFPNKSGLLITKILINDILSIHNAITYILYDQPSVSLAGIADKALLDIIKNSIKETDNIPDKAIVLDFNSYVRDCLDSGDLEIPRPKLGFSTDANGNISKIIEPYPLHGLEIKLHQNGKIASIGMYDDGKPEGMWLTFHDDGELFTKFDHTLERRRKEEEAASKKRTQSFLENISLVNPDDFRDDNEEAGFGSIIAGSVAALTLSALFKNMKKNKKVLKKKEESAKEVVEEVLAEARV